MSSKPDQCFTFAIALARAFISQYIWSIWFSYVELLWIWHKDIKKIYKSSSCNTFVHSSATTKWNQPWQQFLHGSHHITQISLHSNETERESGWQPIGFLLWAVLSYQIETFYAHAMRSYHCIFMTRLIGWAIIMGVATWHIMQVINFAVFVLCKPRANWFQWNKRHAWINLSWYCCQLIGVWNAINWFLIGQRN